MEGVGTATRRGLMERAVLSLDCHFVTQIYTAHMMILHRTIHTHAHTSACNTAEI